MVRKNSALEIFGSFAKKNNGLIWPAIVAAYYAISKKVNKDDFETW